MTDTNIGILERLGFTTYEARAWLALATHAPATGYEVAKSSGIPRANIYPVLKRLVERGAARRIEAHDNTRYTATPVDELLADLRHDQQRLFAQAQERLPRTPAPADEIPVYALQDFASVHAAVRRTIDAARHTLFIAVQPEEARLLAPELRGADERGVRITTLCMEACTSECGGCRGDIHRCALAPSGSRWLIVAADDQAAVAAELKGAAAVPDSVRAIETRQPLVVKLATAYVRQSVALSILGGALGDHFKGLVSLQARQLLDDLHLPEGLSRTIDEDRAARPEPSAR
ncbi:MAG: hypothetical protein EPN72_06645 [Nevskiaceae bacterium]|nr:MAG: hypothetical protein EPN63_10345 [Nevskiaceae bacterium]TBR73361.1 MAG: hypothetical protein EPN72_06645 [Nevskiaceae bacterium]